MNRSCFILSVYSSAFPEWLGNSKASDVMADILTDFWTSDLPITKREWQPLGHDSSCADTTFFVLKYI
jgi:hypothetical protein